MCGKLLQLVPKAAGWPRDMVCPSGAEIDTNTTPWSEATRAKHRQSDYCRQHDLTDEEWRHVAPLIPAQGRMGRPRSTDSRRVFDALSAGAGGRARPVPAQAGEPFTPGSARVVDPTCPRAGGGTLVETMSNPCRRSPSMLDRRPAGLQGASWSAATSRSGRECCVIVFIRRTRTKRHRPPGDATSKGLASVPSSGSPAGSPPPSLRAGPRPPRVV